eukprot:COSAG05_NODE_1359_length_5097_cov_2.531813_6_plen_58_part_01
MCYMVISPLLPIETSLCDRRIAPTQLLPYPLTPCFFRLRRRLVRGRIELLVLSVQVGR